MDEGTYITVREASRQADRQEQTIRRWIREGKLKRYRSGPNRVMICSRELDELLRPVEIGEDR